MSKMKNDFNHELPLIRLYAILYIAGIFLGTLGVILSFDMFSSLPSEIFSSGESIKYISIFFRHFLSFLILYILGLTIVGLPFLPFFPLYKGFSISVIISFVVISNGLRGFIWGILAFLLQNLISLVLGYFICISSARLSISFFELLRNRGKHSALYRDFLNHTVRFLIITPILLLISVWQWKIVPIIIELF